LEHRAEGGAVTGTIVDRDVIVDLLRREYAALIALGEPLDEAAWSRPTCLPGWTVKDQLSHLTGTESMLLGEPTPDVDTSQLTHIKNDIGAANEAWVESMRPLSGAEVVERFQTVTDRRLEALDEMTQADFDAPSWTPAGPDETYGRFMRIRHYDCFMHELDQREGLGVADRTDADHVSAALAEPVTSLGFIVGKRAGMPTGARVRIGLHGPVEATHLVEVGERAAVVESLSGEPTVGIDLDAMLFLRLTGGRRDATPHLGTDIALEGDEDLARQLATHLSFTI
jgi:uncharacterized protein (TIGR03083 family)